MQTQEELNHRIAVANGVNNDAISSGVVIGQKSQWGLALVLPKRRNPQNELGYKHQKENQRRQGLSFEEMVSLLKPQYNGKNDYFPVSRFFSSLNRKRE